MRPQQTIPKRAYPWGIMAILLGVWLTVLPGLSQAQTTKDKSALEKEKKENLAKIKEAEEILKTTESKRKVTLGQLNNINHQIAVQQQLIKTIEQEVILIKSDINETSAVVSSLQEDLETLKAEYARMLVHTHKKSQGHSRLSFLFSASDFNQFLMRLKYLEKYAESRQNQVIQIEYVKESLEGQLTDLEVKREEQSVLLGNKLKENNNLISLRQKKNTIINDLSKQEQSLRTELAERKEALQNLEKLIADLVREEAERNRSSQLTADLAKLSKSFANNRRKLNWPVETGFISSYYGKQSHPVLQNVEIDNRGIDIQTAENQSVKAVYDGIVASVAFVPGMNNVVLIKHGDYFTLYARLKSVNVKKGEVISASQSIGEVFTDSDGVTELQFQVWKNNTTLNPSNWLQKR